MSAPFAEISYCTEYKVLLNIGYYRCPLCGRGGSRRAYVDKVHKPICTEGDYSCLNFQIAFKGLEPVEMVGHALRKVFVKSEWAELDLDVLGQIAMYTISSCIEDKDMYWV